MTIAFDTVVASVVVATKAWERITLQAIAQSEAFNGATNTATATIKIENLVEVRNHSTGAVVPILKICAASGTVC